MRDNYMVEEQQSGLGLPNWEIVYYDDDVGDVMPVVVATIYTKMDAEHIAELLNEEEPG